MQGHADISGLTSIRNVVFDTEWSGTCARVTLLVTANALLGSAAAVWGGDWRNVIPSACLGAVFGQHVVYAIFAVWGRGSIAARAMLQCLAVGLTAPVLAMSIRPQVAWVDLNECLAALFVCAAVLTIAVAAARLLGFQVRPSPSTARGPHAQWWFMCIWLLLALSLRPRVTGLADVKERLTVLLHCATVLAVAFAAARRLQLRIRRPPSIAPSPNRQWSLSTIFSITTALCIWLGMAVALGPYVTQYRHNPAHWGAMLAADELWIPIACAACIPRPPLRNRLMLVPFVACPLAVVFLAWLDVGQHDGFVQLWFAGPHQNHPFLDFMLSSGFGARLIVNEIEVALVTAFFALGRTTGGTPRGRPKGVIGK